jgi:hypothetical protein
MSALLGKDPSNEDMAGIALWLEGGTHVFCAEGGLATAKGIRRLLAESEALRSIASLPDQTEDWSVDDLAVRIAREAVTKSGEQQ